MTPQEREAWREVLRETDPAHRDPLRDELETCHRCRGYGHVFYSDDYVICHVCGGSGYASSVRPEPAFYSPTVDTSSHSWSTDAWDHSTMLADGYTLHIVAIGHEYWAAYLMKGVHVLCYQSCSARATAEQWCLEQLEAFQMTGACSDDEAAT